MYFDDVLHQCTHFIKKKGRPVHVAPACAGSGEGSDHFGSIVRSLSLHFCKRLFAGLEPVTSWSQGSSFTTAPRLPFFFVFDLGIKCGYFITSTIIKSTLLLSRVQISFEHTR